LPFTSFQPLGIRVPINEDDIPDVDDDADEPIEVDGLGIATVALKVKHTLDTTEKVKRKKRKGGAAKAAAAAAAKPKSRTWWEDWDELEFSRTGSYDRNTSPIDRFASAAVDFKQGRPWPPASTGLHNLWDQFRLYTGLLSQPNAHATGSKKHAVSDDEDELDDEQEPMHVDPPVKETDITVAYVGPQSGPSTRAKPPASSEAKYQWEQDTRMEKFMSDPETSMRIFFSSYFRDRGLIWSPARCLAFPTLIAFFLRFLLRSKAFPEPHIEKPLRRALAVVDLARKELPATARIGAVLPDAFSEGARDLWGSMRPAWNEAVVLEKEGATVVAASAGWGDATGTGTGWGEAADGGGWGEAAQEVDNDWAGVASGTPPAADAAAVWGTPRTLFPLLGPSALPLTHTTGVVEWSTRRIARVERALGPRACKKAKGPSADAVEEALGRRFAALVLVPWPGWDKGGGKAAPDIEKPVIMSTSRGAVVLDEDGRASGEAPEEAHNPFADEIRVLVEPKAAEVLEPVVGMGLGATWVEIARVEGEKKGKMRVKYWYMEQLMQQLPSYH
ncbi:hypothetical protein OF83DRAFT_1031632, partial [Amylostereum chailletii]